MSKIYCLDTNVLIEPWNKYYSMKLCPEYWNVIDDLAKKGMVFCTQEVRQEIGKVDDDLDKWIQERPHLFKEVTVDVQKNLRQILSQFKALVDAKKDRSMADPWVIAHAMAEKAVVVTKEPSAPSKIKIPDVCKALSVPCIDDFNFCVEVGIKFSAKL